jgi:hypothetical protein
LIRVAFAEAVAYPAAVPDVDLGHAVAVAHSAPNPTNRESIEWTHALPAVTLAGVIAAALMIFPLAGFGIGMVFSGALAVSFYHRRAPNSNLTSWMGTQLGALSGAIGFGLFTVFVAVVTLFSGTQRLRSIALDAISQSIARTADPQVRLALEYFKSPSGLVFMLIMGCFSLFLLFLLFSALGGAIGATWMRRRKRP